MAEYMIKSVTVSENGQISIPKEICRQMEIKKGSKLVIILKDKRLLISKVTTNASQLIKDDFADTIQHSKNCLKDVWDNEADNIWNKYLKI